MTKQAWTVYSTDADGSGFVEMATTWNENGPIPESRRIVGRFATDELALDAARRDQESYDRLRNTMAADK